MRYIDADALRAYWLENGENEYVYDTNTFLDSIDNALTADVVEVVRCKDCKHFHRAILEEVYGYQPDWGICDCEWFNSEDCDVTENDFCSYGERRNDG